MPDVNTVIQLINGVGFPIACCCGLAWFIVWDKKERAKERLEVQQNQENILAQLKESVDNNTKLIKQMMKRIGGKDDE